MKKVLLALCAVAMLFAFTACEQQVPNIPIAGDNEIANIVVTEAPSFYAGTTENEGYGTITIERVGGRTTTGVTALFSIDGTVEPGTNAVTVSFGSNNQTKWNTTVEAISVESLDVEYDEKDLEKEISAPTDLTVKARGVYTDGTKTEYLALGTVVTRDFNEERTAIVYTLGKGTYSDSDVTASVDVKVAPEEDPTVSTTWTVQVADEDGVYSDYNATDNKPSINYGQTKADVLSQIRVIEKVSTTPVGGGEATETTRVLTANTDYVVQGIANEAIKPSYANGATTATQAFTIVPLVDTEANDIVFNTGTVSYDIVNAIDWAGIKVDWAANPAQLKVGGTLTISDLQVTLTRLDDTAITTGYSAVFIGVHSFPATDYKEGDQVSPKVRITYNSESSDVITLTAKPLAKGE